MQNPNTLRPLFADPEMIALFQKLDTRHVDPLALALFFQVLSRLRATAKRQGRALRPKDMMELQALVPFIPLRQIRRMMMTLRKHGIISTEYDQQKKQYRYIRIDDRRIVELIKEIENNEAWERIKSGDRA